LRTMRGVAGRAAVTPPQREQVKRAELAGRPRVEVMEATEGLSYLARGTPALLVQFLLAAVAPAHGMAHFL
jgi:hypothetical protein